MTKVSSELRAIPHRIPDTPPRIPIAKHAMKNNLLRSSSRNRNFPHPLAIKTSRLTAWRGQNRKPAMAICIYGTVGIQLCPRRINMILFPAPARNANSGINKKLLNIIPLQTIFLWTILSFCCADRAGNMVPPTDHFTPLTKKKGIFLDFE